uniref:Fibroblast growth factor receptor substrate 3 n=1 Tax=Lepisosteus oculatus TaxID=7918 RepID=W5N4T0_LEPOC
MGSCWSCLYRDTIPDTHPTKFKENIKYLVTNVDDEGNELGSGIMELTQTELILHTRKRDAVRWPYLCLRRYGYDSNLFSFESGRRCQTGQGIFAFKCSRAEEIFNLLQELMQCNSINVVEEPVIITHNSHAPELELPRTPQTPSTPAYTVQGFPNGYPGYPVSADGSSHPSTRHPSLAEDHAHGFMGLEDQAHTYVNTASVEGDVRGRHCVHSLPEVRPNPYPESARGGGGGPGGHPVIHCCPLEERNPQVFLQPPSGEVKFVLGPTPAQRRLMDMEREALGKQVHMRHPHGHLTLEGVGGGGSEHEEEGCQAVRLAYENINGLGGGRGGELRRGGGSGRLKLCPGSVSLSGGSSSSSNRKTALLNYENLPSLPPVWEYRALQREEEQDEEDDDGTPNGYHQDGGGDGRDVMRNYVNTERVQPGVRRPACPPRGQHRADCHVGGGGGVFSFDFRRGGGVGRDLSQQRQLNYIQVDLDGDSECGNPQQQHQKPVPIGTSQPPRHSEFYAVIDLKKTAAMSSLQRALPRDDGTSRKTRHNSTDLPL